MKPLFLPSSSRFLTLAALAALAMTPSCGKSPEARRDPEAKPVASAGPSEVLPTPRATTAPLPAMPAVLARGLRFVKAPRGQDVVSIVKAQREDAKAFGRDLVVYVGATWCEPCQRFHQAAQAGMFDDVLPQLTLLEFDLDEDRERLVSAGYVSQFIPLFVLPGDAGKPTSSRFEGGIKGDGAAQHVASRLRAMFER